MLRDCRRILFGVAVIAILGACGAGAEDSAADGGVERGGAAPEGSREDVRPALRLWRLDSFGPAADLGDPATAERIVAALASLPDDRPVTFGLAVEGRVAGFSGCNRYSGDLRIESGGEIVQGPKSLTRMACPEGQTLLERSFLGNLERAKRAELRDDRLELVNEDASFGVILVFSPTGPDG